jgi:hypothetical protein
MIGFPDSRRVRIADRSTRSERAAFFLILLIAFLPLLGAQQPSDFPQPSFRTLQVFINPHGKSMAVYQFEFIGDPDVKLVGIEAGEAKGFTDPPYYDAAALAGGRVIVGAYSLANDLPAGPTHIATLHVRVGTGEPRYELKLKTAGGRDGSPIACDISIREGARP